MIGQDQDRRSRSGRRPKERLLTALLITDIIDSSGWVIRLGDRRWLALLGAHDRVIQDLVQARGGRTIKHLGDGLIAVFTSASDAVACAQDAARAVSRLSLQIRCGVHAGEVSVRGDDVFGLTVHTASRLAAASRPGEVLVSPIVRNLTNGAGPRFEDAGNYQFKGLGKWRLYRLKDDGSKSMNRKRSGRGRGGEDE